MPNKAVLRIAFATLLLTSLAQAQTLDQTLSGCNGAAPLNTIQATDQNYLTKIAGLVPGDRLLLAAGTYTGLLDLEGKNGQPGKCIVIEGPSGGPPARFTSSDTSNVISLENSSYIALRNLTLDGAGKWGDGVKAEATATSVHHILIDGLTITNFNMSQQVVGINTKCPAWNWVVRNTTITNAGTGMYFGGSEGEFPHTNFLIEHNLVHTTLGYNVQFKHQISRNTAIGMPASGTTIIRHNVFSKETGSSTSSELVRPNLLVGHWPTSGDGTTDIYQIYGNLFYLNPTESLFQGEGNIALHDNLFVTRTGSAVRIQPHYDVPRRIEAFNNTIVAFSRGIYITGANTQSYTQRVVGNAVFAATPLDGGQQSNNITNTYNLASNYLNNPGAALGAGLDLYPKTGQLQSTAIDHSVFSGLVDYDRDFNSNSRVSTFRGAYSGDGVNLGWSPALAIKPPAGTPPPGNVLQNGVPVTGLSGTLNSQQIWTMTVPEGASNVVFQTSGGTGDMDMHVRFGSAPTLSTYDCRPFESGNNEICTFPTTAAGTWYVMLHGYAAYSGMTLTGSYTPPSSGSVLQNDVPVTAISGAQTSQKFWTMSVPSGMASLQIQTFGGSGDVDLYVKFGSAPTLSTWDCRPFASGNTEKCFFAAPAAGTWHVLLVGDDPYSGVTLLGNYGCNAISDVEPNDTTSAPQVLSGWCNQISGTFLNDSTSQQNDYFRVSLPAGRTVTALLNGLTVDYDLFLYNASGSQVASSTNGGTTADQASWTNTTSSAVNVYVKVLRYSTTRTTYQLRVTY